MRELGIRSVLTADAHFRRPTWVFNAFGNPLSSCFPRRSRGHRRWIVRIIPFCRVCRRRRLQHIIGEEKLSVARHHHHLHLVGKPLGDNLLNQ